jgi:hypothetical protein
MTITTSIPAVQNPPDNPLTEGAAPPVSERLIRALEAHVAAEEDDAVRAGQLVDASGDQAFNVLLELIVEDAQRHEGLLTRMVKRLRNELELTDSPNAVPIPTSNAFARVEETVAVLRTLIRNQQEGARYLRHLARQDSDLYDGYFALLLDTFARDGEKHVHLLRYLLRRVEAQ